MRAGLAAVLSISCRPVAMLDDALCSSSADGQMEPDEAMKATSQLVEGLKKDARDMPWLEGVLESLEKRA